MSGDADDGELFGRLARLVAASRTIDRRDRRAILSLEADLHAVRAAFNSRCGSLLEELSVAGARSKAAAIYSRVASFGHSAAPAQNKRFDDGVTT